MLNRRRLLQGSAAVALAGLGRTAFAQEPAVPIVFVHGDSDLAATWETQIWRFESNGYPRDRLFAISFTDPQARDDDTVAQANRSSTQDQLRELTAFIDDVKAKTGAPKVALVALSRGGYATREYAAAYPGSVEKAALGGTPNHGVWATDFLPGSEYNGRGPFLTKLDTGEAEVTPGVPFLTLRSDGFDLYAQPDGAIVFHKPGMALNVTDGPALKGATNVLLGEVDHRETALSPVAFADIYRFIAGREPSRISIAPEAEVVLNGRVTGVAVGTPTTGQSRARRWKSIASPPTPASGKAPPR
jgi:pimeloyl-ACP methyl ester carboxylesterase